MPGNDVDHVSRPPDHSGPRHFRRKSSQSSNDLIYDASLNQSINASLADSISSPPRGPLRTVTFPLRDLPGPHQESGRASPDPHEFYRQYPRPDIDTGKQQQARDSASSKTRPTPFQRIASLPTYDTLDSSRTNGGAQNRSVSDTSYRALDNTEATSKNPITATRSRQVSFKDLINKFEKTNDQVLPMPPRFQDRSASASPAGSPTSTKFSSGDRWNTNKASTQNVDGDIVAPIGMVSETNGKAQVSVDSRPSIPRRPLKVGEHLSVDTSVHNSAAGIPPHMRRGSEGSVPSPNPATLDQLDPSSGRSPLTPTAWYLGKTPFLEAVDPSADASRSHRRVRSDLPGITSAGFAASKSAWSSPHMAAGAAPLQQSQPQQPPSVSTSLESPHSKSRIPISSRHLNSAFVSDASPPRATPSTTFSSRSAAQIALPPKGISRLPKPSSPPDSLPGMSDYDSPESFATGSTGTVHGRVRQQQSGRNPLLQAYIAPPPPQKTAPPLRSSRPRKPVSNATSPTGTGSKVVERVSSLQRQINRDRELRASRRERKLPELGHVDFATRRQRIQQAFNRTVQENERKEEEAAELRRQVEPREEVNADDRYPPSHGQLQQQNQFDILPTSTAEDGATVIDDQDETCHVGRQPQPTEHQHLTSNNNHNHPSISEPEPSRFLPSLHIDTRLPPLPELPSATTAMDSPTLGLPMVSDRGATIPRSEPKSSHLQPMSAVTLESTDTHVTTLDPEPQSGLDHPDTSHRTLLSQIMQFRESSPSDESSCDEPDYSLSDNDEKESIPIMLRDAACFEESVNGNGTDDQETCDASDNSQDQTGDEPPSNRWSASSWSSSLRQHFAEARFENGSGEDLSHAAGSADDSEVTTQSCSASSSTPPSVIGHQFTVTPPQPSVGASDSKGEQASTQNTLGRSSAPSLARLGGWDSKRVTQLYFEELARGRGPNLSVPGAGSSPEPRRSDLTDQRSDGRTDSLTDDPVLVSSLGDVPGTEQPRNSATLLFRDDWEHASPSIADWMQVAADSDSSEGERIVRARKRNDDLARQEKSKTESSGAHEAEKNLGLAINVQGRQQHNSSGNSSEPQGAQSTVQSETTPKETTTKQPPPLPNQPQASSDAPSRQVQQRPSHVPTQSGNYTPLGLVQSTGSSESSSLQYIETTSSLRAHAVDSSVTSLVPSQSEPTSVDLKRPSPSPEQRRLKKRRHVIKELIDTEYTFCRDMKVVDDIYKGTSSSCLDLSTDDVKILFGNSDQVVQFSTAFQDTLKRSAKSVYVMPKSQRWSSKRVRNRQLNGSSEEQSFMPGTEASDLEKDQATFVGQAFMAHMAQMEKVYADYLKNHDAANKKLQILQKNPKVTIWLQECRDWASDLTSAWDLDSLLVKPVQRILKYPLLLSELLDSTPAEHPDHASLVNALEEVTNISVRINEMKKRADLVGQVVGRKRNQSDVRAGLSKAFGRRSDKLRQQVGNVADMFEDKEYNSLSQRFGDSYFQMQVVMRDVESYTQEAQGSMNRFNEFVLAIESYVDVAQSSWPDLEQRWRQLKTVLHDIMTVALPEHVSFLVHSRR